MNSKYSRLELNKVTDEAGTATDHGTIMEKVKAFYQKLYKRRVQNNNYGEFLDFSAFIFTEFAADGL